LSPCPRLKFSPFQADVPSKPPKGRAIRSRRGVHSRRGVQKTMLCGCAEGWFASTLIFSDDNTIGDRSARHTRRLVASRCAIGQHGAGIPAV
jgi:hypothetical protein